MSLPIVVHSANLPWETWPDAEIAAHSHVVWKDLISADRTASQRLSLGIGEIPPGQALAHHHHATPEVYYIVAGSGVVVIAETQYPVETGAAVFLPSDVPHHLQNTGTTPLQFVYVFPVDSVQELVYHFEG